MNKTLSKSSVRELALIGIMTAATCVLAPFSIPVGAVPISLTTFAIYLGIYAIGAKREVISCAVYLLLGLVGLPVFSGFAGGAAKLFGPTGGYLLGFIPMAIVAGAVIDRFYNKRIICILGMAAGTLICYATGTAWLAYQTKIGFKAALMAGVVPFIIGDIAKMIIAAFLGCEIKRALLRANLK